MHTFAVEYIFSKEVFEATGGFVEFPLAWGSDDATWVKFAGNHNISIIKPAKVKWRLSDQNISGITNANGETKTNALLLYGKWITDHFKSHPEIEKLKTSMCNFILQQVKGYLGIISVKQALKLYTAGIKIWGFSPVPVLRIFISR
ncbi:MAG: hypothetical protein EOO89_26085 [Pedobacter sp.]|nr:MAG: hypothetical protein EOO89_26085 [Pedobacter sp.]